MARYLILGGAGFIGQPLIRHLVALGHEVTNLDIRAESSTDLRTSKIKNLENYNGCIFLAWDVGGSKYLNAVQTWSSQYENNIGLMSNVFPQLAQAGIRTLFVSSQLAGIDSSPYSLTKLTGENYAQTLQNFVVARQWNAYGDMEAQDLRSHVISDFVYQAVKNKKIEMITDGSEMRKFIHMSDISEAYTQLLSGDLQGIYDVSGSEYVSILDIATYVASLTGADLRIGTEKGNTPKAHEIPSIPDWQPKVSLKSGIQTMISTLSSQA